MRDGLTYGEMQNWAVSRKMEMPLSHIVVPAPALVALLWPMK